MGRNLLKQSNNISIISRAAAAAAAAPACRHRRQSTVVLISYFWTGIRRELKLAAQSASRPAIAGQKQIMIKRIKRYQTILILLQQRPRPLFNSNSFLHSRISAGSSLSGGSSGGTYKLSSQL